MNAPAVPPAAAAPVAKKIAIAHDQLVVASFEFAGAHIPQASGGGIIFRQHRIELTAERHSFLDLTEQLVALLVQQLLAVMRPHPSFEEAMTEALERLAEKL